MISTLNGMNTPDDVDAIIGVTEPRVATPPAVALEPATSYGYELIEFAELIGLPLDPWEQLAAIRLGELRPDGTPRWRIVLIIVARQNGKTTLARVWILWCLFWSRLGTVLGLNSDRGYARIQWEITTALAQEHFAGEIADVRKTLNQEALITTYGTDYRIGAVNRRAGRSLTIAYLLADELREHLNWDAWTAAENAMNAVKGGQVLAITNMGDATSSVLNALRESALTALEVDDTESDICLLEWSAEPGAEIDDPVALAAANPNLGRRLDTRSILAKARRIKASGDAEQILKFRTEVLCQYVPLLDPAIDPEQWATAAGTLPDLAEHRDRVALCLDVSLDGLHATLLAAAKINGVTYVDPVATWDGAEGVRRCALDLPDIARRVRPRAVGYWPNGPAAAIVADLEQPAARWPRRVDLVALRAEQTAACMALPALIKTGELTHGDDPLINAHIGNTQRLRRGDGWVFQRQGAAPIDAAYALAGAVHLARTIKPPKPPLRVVRAGDPRASEQAL